MPLAVDLDRDKLRDFCAAVEESDNRFRRQSIMNSVVLLDVA